MPEPTTLARTPDGKLLRTADGKLKRGCGCCGPAVGGPCCDEDRLCTGRMVPGPGGVLVEQVDYITRFDMRGAYIRARPLPATPEATINDEVADQRTGTAIAPCFGGEFGRNAGATANNRGGGVTMGPESGTDSSPSIGVRQGTSLSARTYYEPPGTLTPLNRQLVIPENRFRALSGWFVIQDDLVATGFEVVAGLWVPVGQQTPEAGVGFRLGSAYPIGPQSFRYEVLQSVISAPVQVVRWAGECPAHIRATFNVVVALRLRSWDPDEFDRFELTGTAEIEFPEYGPCHKLTGPAQDPVAGPLPQTPVQVGSGRSGIPDAMKVEAAFGCSSCGG